jgi:hypothetical protein
MNEKNNQKVYSVNGRLQAIWMGSILEQAGIPVNLRSSKTGAYLDIYVPDSYAYDAKKILNPEYNKNASRLCQVSL